MSEEIWKPIPLKELDGLYEASNLGRIRRAPRLCTVYTFDTGRHYVMLSSPKIKKRLHNKGRRGNLKNLSVHRLVAMTFCGPVKDGLQVNHKNGRKTDNRAKNLEWVTAEQNYEHARKNGLYKSPPNKKIDTKRAIKMHKSGLSYRAIARALGCSDTAVAYTFKHALYGVPWKSSGVKRRAKHRSKS